MADQDYRTFFDPETGKFVLSDQASPLVGWDIQQLISHTSGFSKDDLHGQLYCFLRHMLEKFAARLQSRMRFAFHVTAQDPSNTQHLEQFRPFDRIETAELLEYEETFLYLLQVILRRQLKTPQESIHATMITIFEDKWYQEMRRVLQDVKWSKLQAVVNFVSLMIFGLPVSSKDPEEDVKLSPVRVLAASIFEPYDRLFQLFMTSTGFAEDANDAQMRMRGENKVLEKWPKRLFKEPEQDGAKQEFDVLLASRTQGQIRVVEWTREE